MAKISKNIKKFRNEQKLTQEELAGRIHITRQAVSNWENDKTQPDLESLKALADAFGIEIEELIYGKKRRAVIAPNRETEKNKMRVILAVIGSLLLGVGLVLVFVSFWQKFPFILKAVLSVVPALAGQACALYVIVKKRENLVWREGGAILWTVGIISAVALVNSVFDIHCGYENCLFVDMLLCLPVFWLMDAVSPVAPYFYMVIHWSYLNGHTAVPLVLFLLGLLFVFLRRNDSADLRHRFLLWTTAAAIPLFVIVQCLNSEVSVVFVLPVFIAYYAAHTDDYDLTFPAKPIGVIGAAAALTIASRDSMTVLLYLRDSDSLLGKEAFGDNLSANAAALIFSAAVIGAGVFIGRETFRKNILKILITASSAAGFAFYILMIAAQLKYLSIIPVLAVCAFGTAIIIKGVSETHFLAVNLGFATVFAQIMFVIRAFDVGLLIIGVLFIVFGAALIGINVKLSAKKKKIGEELQ